MERTLAAEIRALRKGPGLLRPALSNYIGRQLALFCGVHIADSDDVLRTKIAGKLNTLMANASQSARTAMRVALAIEPGAQQQTLTARRDWLAEQQRCDARTIRRQEERAFEWIAAELAGRSVAKPSGHHEAMWTVRAFRAALNLSGVEPELFEERTIVAASDRLSEITLSLSVAAGAAAAAEPVKASLLYGGLIVSSEQPTPSHFRYTLRLPRELQAAEEYRYAIFYRVPAARPLRPHYVFHPLHPCQTFELTVKFDLARPPRRCWRIEQAPPRMVDDGVPTDLVLTVDAVGEVTADFADLRQGFSYGIGWQ